MKSLKSNEFWGRRSGSTNEKGKVFQQMQWGSGPSNSKKAKKTIYKLIMEANARKGR
jgi:hypothetical protein